MRVNRVSDEKKQRMLGLAQQGWHQGVTCWTAREARLAAHLRDLLDRRDWRSPTPSSDTGESEQP